MSVADDNILSSVENGVGWITLNRPRALNALSLEMIRKMTSLLKSWDMEGSGVKVIVVKGAGERAFCSGGDIKTIAKAKGEQFQKDFIKEEYLLDHLVGSLRVPYITILDGITMGGGVGISVNGRFRVGTEKTVFAMPECGIGLIPDVGAGYFLAKLEGKLGLFLGLTGYRVSGWECFRFGITTHAVKSDMVEQLEYEIRELAGREGKLDVKEVEQLLDKWTLQEAKEHNTGCVSENLKEINTLFTAESLEDIFKNLQNQNTKFSISTKESLMKNSPTSMMLAFKQLKEGKPTHAEALIVEHRLMTRRFQDPDFYEGVRAALIDKDQKPKWNPDSINKISQKLVDNYFTDFEPQQELII
eukprot:TRINITY_DN14380_c0_g1_i1.p1 TRINITY_DN14380_c0_g1~~TRINITY_DN14380_c0_g1_i1.p1  ORF type:complete len:373 (-),score=98.30 TRINITY_DN14380_c0_g1_i1:444-1520(-)